MAKQLSHNSVLYHFKRGEPIPQKFYVRKVQIGTKAYPVYVYVYWNYRGSIRGAIHLDRQPRKIKGVDDRSRVRDYVMTKIQEAYPEAEFFRHH